MTSWVAAIPAMAVSILVLYLPGLAAGYLLGLRRLWWWAFAPLFSIASYSILAISFPYLSIPWSIGTAAIGAAIVCAAIVVIGRLLLRARFEVAPGAARSRWTFGALLFSGGGLLCIGVVGIGDPAAVSQTWDGIFHYGALRQITETGVASPFGLAAFSNPRATSSYYPGAWHAAASLVALLDHLNLPLAVNAFNMVVVALVWPASIMLLSRQLAGRSPIAVIATGALAAAFPAYPLNTLTYGVLYPFFLGIALLPAALAAFLQLIGLAREPRIGPLRLLGALALLGTGAVALAHPSAFAGMVVLSGAVVVVSFASEWPRASAVQRIVRTVSLLGFAVVALVLFLRLRTSWGWPAQTSLPDAMAQVLTGSVLGAGLPLAMSALLLAGLVFSIVRRDRHALTALLMWAVAAALYTITAGAPDQWFRRLVSAWYADAPRLGALLVVTVVPLAAYGLSRLWAVLSVARPLGRVGASIVATLILVSILLTSGYPQFVPLMRLAHDGDSVDYIDSMPGEERQLLSGISDQGLDPVNNVLSDDERELVSRLHEHVPEGATIVGSPWTGTTYAYAFAGYPLLYSYMGTDPSPDAQRILWGFAFEADTPEMCEVLERTGAEYILDFGTREVLSGRHEYPGIENLEGNPAVELVDRQGEAKLFKITSCGLGG